MLVEIPVRRCRFPVLRSAFRDPQAIRREGAPTFAKAHGQ
jgi:hypothetical protein